LHGDAAAAATSNISEKHKRIRECVSSLTLEEKQAEYDSKASVEALRILEAIESTPTAALVPQADKIAKLDSVARKTLALGEHRPVVVGQRRVAPDVAERQWLKNVTSNTERLNVVTMQIADSIEVTSES
jgi:hypothetical protein